MSDPVILGAVVVVNYASAHLIDENLVPLRESLPPAVAVVVVDNFSGDSERARVEDLARRAGIILVSPSENLGFGGGVDAGVRSAVEAGASAVVVLNPDAVADADTVLEMLRRADGDPEMMLSPVVRRSDGTVWFDGSDLHLLDGRIKATRRRGADDVVFPWLSGACIALSADLWHRVGGFDDDYFLYWEDVDLSWKVVEAGGRLEVARDLTVVHDEGGTQTRRRTASAGAKSDIYYYYNVRNRLVFASKRLDREGMTRWLANSREVAREIVMQGGRRQFLRRPLGPWLAARRGLREGRAVLLARLDEMSGMGD